MKLLIVGSDKIFAIENFYVKYLRELGIEVVLFPAHSIFYDYYLKNIFNKVMFRSGLSFIYKKINIQFKETIVDFKPDLIWVFKGMEIYPDTLEWTKKKTIKLVNYNPDNPFIFSGKGSGNSNVKNSISLYDLHLTYNSVVKKEIEEVYKINSGILPFGFDITDELLNTCMKVEEIKRVCFLGNPDLYRGNFLQKLAESGIRLDVYGHRWQKFVDHPNINLFEPVYREAFWTTLRKYRIQLNIMRPHNPDTHNMRSFEIPGVGGIQLAPATNDHKTYFEPEKEIYLYTNMAQCVSQINEILDMPTNRANEIRLQARKRSIQSRYTYKDRAGEALGYFKTLYD